MYLCSEIFEEGDSNKIISRYKTNPTAITITVVAIGNISVHKKRRASSKSSSADAYVDAGLSVSNVKKSRMSDRICNTLDELNDHLKLFQRGTNAKACEVCEVCGKKMLWKWSNFNKDMCAPASRNWNEGCMLAFHNTQHIILWIDSE